MAATPTVIGRYQIRSRLGEGGMGVVYLAHDPAMDSDVAIKLLRSPMADDALRKRFAREAQMARRVGIHPNVVTIFDIGEHEGDPFIAMEYVSGETLEHMIRRQALPRPTRRLQIVEDLCTGLTHAHKAGLVHRDIKPANVMLADDGTVKILDFGVARAAESDLTADGMVVGALNYMSPEQMTGSALDARSDVFAVGALFYELLSGRRAFPGSIREGLPYRIIHGMPPPLSEVVADVDPDIERIILKALEKDAAKRYQDVGTMRQDIARVRRRLEHVQIERALTQAREAFDTGDYEAVVASCTEVTTLDPDEPRALELLERTESARTGEHAHTTSAAALTTELAENDRPTIALQAPALAQGVQSPQSAPLLSVPPQASALPSAPAPVAGITPSPVVEPPVVEPPVVRQSQSSSRALIIAIATLLIAGVAAIAAAGWLVARYIASRPPSAAPAAATRLDPSSQSAPPQSAATPSAPSQSGATPASATPAQSPTAAPSGSASVSTQPPAQPGASTPAESAAAPSAASAPPGAAGPSTAAAASAAPQPQPETPVEAPAAQPNAATAATSAAAARPPASSQGRPASALSPTAPAAGPAAASGMPPAAASAATATSSPPVDAEGGDPTPPANVGDGQDPRDGRRSADDLRYGDGGRYGRSYPGRDGRYPPPRGSDRSRGDGYGGGGRYDPDAPEGEIRRAMRMFQAAWDRLDLDGMRRIYPGFVGGPAAPFRNYTIEFEDMRIFVNGRHASVHTRVRQTLRSRMGGGSRPNQMIYRFEQRLDGRWLINGAQRVPD